MAEPEDGGPLGVCEDDQRQRGLLADTIAAFAAEIERRWLTRLKTVLAEGRSDLSPTELRDAMPDYLAGLADAMRGEKPTDQGGLAAWERVARQHGVTRVRLGFDVDQLVREFILLRRVLFEVAHEQNVIREDPWSQHLTDLIETAIATSVRSYVESRDVADRRMQAEHIGFLTHELRNPLFMATIAATQLRRRPEVVAAAGDKLDLLERGLERMRTLIEGILLAQRMEAREIECRPVELTLEEVMPDASRAAELEARNKGVDFVAEYDPSTHIRVDPALTASALQNVFDNAVKYTDQGRVRVIADPQQGEVMIHVYDDCNGVSPAEIKTIFQPFKRAHSGKAGTGLGLAIARRAIETQGGRIGAESNGERGCHFWLTLPRPPH